MTDADNAMLRELAAFYNGIDRPVGFGATFISGDLRKLPASFRDALKAMGVEPLASRPGYLSTRALQRLRRRLSRMHNVPTGGYILRRDPGWGFDQRFVEHGLMGSASRRNLDLS